MMKNALPSGSTAHQRPWIASTWMKPVALPVMVALAKRRPS